MYTPKTGAKCGCKPGIGRDNCSACEGTGLAIDFRAIHAARAERAERDQADAKRCADWVCGGHLGIQDN